MRNASRSIGMMVSCVVLICACRASARDWPQWRGANRDGKVTGFTAPATWPKALKKKWKAKVGLGDATPVLAGNQLFVFTRQGADEVTLCFDADSGRQLWKVKHAAQAVTGPGRRHAGPRSTPAVADGKVVTVGVGGVVTCLDADTGKPLWRKDPFPKVVPTFFPASSPIIVDQMAVVHVGGKGKGAIIAYGLADGAEKWRSADDLPPEYASPVLLTVAGTKQLVALTEKDLVGIGAADGKLLWKFPWASARMSTNSATPIVDGQTVIVTGSGRGIKAVKIEKQAVGFAPKELWSNADVSTVFNTPVLKGGLLFGLSKRNKLFCLDARTGKTAWTDTASNGRSFGAIVDVGSAILALPNSSELIAFKPSAKGYAELARIKVADTPTYAHPVISGKRIFVKDEETVTMWTLE